MTMLVGYLGNDFAVVGTDLLVGVSKDNNDTEYFGVEKFALRKDAKSRLAFGAKSPPGDLLEHIYTCSMPKLLGLNDIKPIRAALLWIPGDNFYYASVSGSKFFKEIENSSVVYADTNLENGMFEARASTEFYRAIDCSSVHLSPEEIADYTYEFLLRHEVLNNIFGAASYVIEKGQIRLHKISHPNVGKITYW